MPLHEWGAFFCQIIAETEPTLISTFTTAYCPFKSAMPSYKVSLCLRYLFREKAGNPRRITLGQIAL